MKLFIMLFVCFILKAMAVTATGWSIFCFDTCTVAATGGTSPYVFTFTTWYGSSADGSNAWSSMYSSTGIITTLTQLFDCKHVNGLATEYVVATDTFQITRHRILLTDENIIKEAIKFD